MPKIQLKILNKDGTRQTIATTKRKRVYANLVRDNVSEVTLKVTYGRGINNSGTYTTTEEAKQALKAWTEKSLIQFLEEGSWDDR